MSSLTFRRRSLSYGLTSYGKITFLKEQRLSSDSFLPCVTRGAAWKGPNCGQLALTAFEVIEVLPITNHQSRYFHSVLSNGPMVVALLQLKKVIRVLTDHFFFSCCYYFTRKSCKNSFYFSSQSIDWVFLRDNFQGGSRCPVHTMI